MNSQLAQLIRYTPISEFKQALRKIIQIDDNYLQFQPQELDTVFMNELLREYEKRQDDNLNAWINLEKYYLQKEDIDKEHFFERQYLMLQKELDQELYFQLHEILFKFRVRMNGTFSIIFRLKQFEAFEQLLKKQIQNLQPQLNSSTKKLQTSYRRTLFNRPSSLGKMLLRAFNKQNMEIESQSHQELLYNLKNINGIDCYQLNEIEQFTKQEQKIILNVSQKENKLVDESDEDDDDDINQNIIHHHIQQIKNDKIKEREKYLEYIYGNTKKLESIIMSSLPFNTIQQVENENMISVTTLQRPLLNNQSAESVLIYGNKLPNKHFIPTERNLWKIAKELLRQKYQLFQNPQKKQLTHIKMYKRISQNKNLNRKFNQIYK